MKGNYDGPCIGKGEGGLGKLLVGVVVLLTASGCGYSLRQRLKSGFENPQGLYVPVFSNDTDEVGAERVFTDALIRELQSRGKMTVTTRRKGAYEFLGKIDRINYYPAGLTPSPLVGSGLQDYRRLPTEIVVEAQVSLQLMDPANGKTLWSGSFSNFRRVGAVLSRTHDYESPSSLALIQQSLIDSQYSGIARDIMRDVYDAMVEIF